MNLTDTQKTVAAVVALAGIGFGTAVYLDKYALAEELRKQTESIGQQIQRQSVQLDFVYDVRISGAQ